MSLLETITPQPRFPDEDLGEVNAAHVRYYILHSPEPRALERSFHDSMRPIHVVAHNALDICGVKVNFSEDEYHAFCSGFAAIEYTGTLVRERQLNGTMAVANTRNLLINSGELADFEIASRYGTWIDTHPNTYSVIVDSGVDRNESMRQLHARTIGAHVASELWAEQPPRAS